MRLQIKLLGGFEANLASGDRIGFVNRKAEALFAYLASCPGKLHSRESLADLLWSDGVDGHARNNLRQTIHALRKALKAAERSPIITERDRIALDRDALEVDAVRFEALLGAGSVEALEAACALYEGEFLEDLSIEAPVFEDWLAMERRRFQDLAVHALGDLLAHKIDGDQPDQAIALAQRLLALDPLLESAHRALMRLYAQTGQRHGALEQYQSCRQILEDELGIEPERETEALHEAIRAGQLASDPAEDVMLPIGEASARGIEPSEDDPTPSPARKVWRWSAVIGSVAVVLAGILLAWFQLRETAIEPAVVANMAFPLPEKPSIAVLPFANLSDDPQQGYFADGMTDDLITDLAKIDGLFVISQHSSFAYKNRSILISEVAEDLGVRYVLEGSVRRTNERIRINAQLIDALTGFHVWAERYDRPLQDMFVLQDKITRRIVSALSMHLPLDDELQTAQFDTDDPEAYDAFLRGRAHGRGFTIIVDPEERLRAVSWFKKAIELDPNYGRAYAALADTYFWFFALGWQKKLGLTQKEVLDLASRYLELAMRDPTPLAYNVAMHVHFVRGEFEKGIAAAKKARALGLKDSRVSDAMTKALLYTGRAEEALDNLEAGVRQDPLNPEEYVHRRAQVHYHLGRFEESADGFRRALEVGQDFTDTYMYLAAAYGQLGRRKQAHAAINRIRIQEKDEGWSYSVLSVDAWAFRSEEIRQQFREGLRKAGLDEIPWGYDPDSPDMVRGDDLRSLYFGRTLKGRDAQSGKERIISISHDGEATSRIGDLVDRGTVDGWHDEKLCIWWKGEGRVCAVTFRNPEGTPDQRNEYDYVYFGGVIPFSPLD